MKVKPHPDSPRCPSGWKCMKFIILVALPLGFGVNKPKSAGAGGFPVRGRTRTAAKLAGRVITSLERTPLHSLTVSPSRSSAEIAFRQAGATGTKPLSQRRLTERVTVTVWLPFFAVFCEIWSLYRAKVEPEAAQQQARPNWMTGSWASNAGRTQRPTSREQKVSTGRWASNAGRAQRLTSRGQKVSTSRGSE